MAELNPFSAEAIESVATGPFSKSRVVSAVTLGQVGPDDHYQDTPLVKGLGFTPDEIRRQLDKVPGFAEALERPEAETLRQYLHGSDKYDMETLNRLVLDLTHEVGRVKASSKGREPVGRATKPVSVQRRALPPEDPEPGLTVRDTGPWWLSR